MKVTHLPYIAPRKHRRQENLRFCVKWIEGTTLYMQWFKRDTPAVAFLQRLEDAGFQARILMK